MTGSISIGWRSSGRIPRSRWRIFGLLSASLPLLSSSAAGFAASQNHADEAASSPPPRIAIVGATLIDPAKSQVLENSIVTIEGNRIIAVTQALTDEVPVNTRVINAHGKWLLPGYIDAHVHFFQSGGLYTRPDSLDLRAIRPYTEEVADLVILRANPLADIRNASEIETVIKDGVEYRATDLLEETPSELVQRQVNAYNARNMEAFIMTYSSDAKLFLYPNLLSCLAFRLSKHIRQWRPGNRSSPSRRRDYSKTGPPQT